jgi:hypothetical protein
MTVEIIRYPLPEGVDDALLTAGELAGTFGVSVWQVLTWAEQGMPVTGPERPGGPQRFTLSACHSWRVACSRAGQARAERTPEARSLSRFAGARRVAGLAGLPGPVPAAAGKGRPFVPADRNAGARVALPETDQPGDASMTASIPNTRSSLDMLLKGLKWFREAKDVPVGERVWMLETLADSAEKCFASVKAQIRFYQSAKGVGRAYMVPDGNGGHRYVSGQLLETLVMHRPGQDTDAVIHGKPEALAAIAAALTEAGHAVAGPAPIHDLARQIAEAATPPEAKADRHDPD